MAGQYELKKFLKLTASGILKEYFAGIGWNPSIEWDSLTKTGVDSLFKAIQGAPEEKLSRINRNFQQVNELATEGGIRALIDEGKFRKLDLGEELKDVSGFHNKILRVFLDHPPEQGQPSILDVARRFNKADKLPGRSWRKRSGVPEVEHAQSKDDDAAKKLEEGRKRLEDVHVLDAGEAGLEGFLDLLGGAGVHVDHGIAQGPARLVHEDRALHLAMIGRAHV